MNNQQETIQPTSLETIDFNNLGIWESFRMILGNITKVTVRASATIDDSVALIQNEVQMLSEEQAIRLHDITAKRPKPKQLEQD